jgi:hypothetical protein
MGPWEIGQVIALFFYVLGCCFCSVFVAGRLGSRHLQLLALTLKAKMLWSRSDNEKRSHRLDGVARPPMNRVWDYCFEVISHTEGYAVIANISVLSLSCQ